MSKEEKIDKILDSKMTFDEFDKCEFKFNTYSKLYESCENLIKENDRQYQLLDSKEKTIQQLKDIMIAIIENIS